MAHGHPSPFFIALPFAEGTIGPRETWLLGFSKMAAAMASKDSNGDGFILVEDASAVIDSYDLVRTYVRAHACVFAREHARGK